MRIEATKLNVRGSGSYEDRVVDSFSFGCHDCINKLCDFIFKDKTNRNSTVIAHNGAGYDNTFTLGWATQHGIYPRKYIRQGVWNNLQNLQKQ